MKKTYVTSSIIASLVLGLAAACGSTVEVGQSVGGVGGAGGSSTDAGAQDAEADADCYRVVGKCVGHDHLVDLYLWDKCNAPQDPWATPFDGWGPGPHYADSCP